VPRATTREESGERFATTRWSIVLGAGGQVSRVDARAALASLCEMYWPPLYAYLRRSGSSRADAEDLVQGLFSELLARDDFAQVRPERGRFRSFLLASLKHYQANERDKQRAQKRGGNRAILSLDVASAEDRYVIEPADHRTPESVFDRSWALAVLKQAQARLRDSYRAAGKSNRYDALSPYLAGEHAESYRDAAAALGMTESAVKVAVHRMRREFRDLIRQEIAQTVASPDEIDDEVRALFDALRA
jgi:RNA polymerase sigma factor (sigma-70 family)